MRQSIGLTIEQVFTAIKSLGDPSVKMRDNGDWYVVVEPSVVLLREGAISSIPVSANSPNNAVYEYWAKVTDPLYAVQFGLGKDVRTVRWNGFMWADVK